MNIKFSSCFILLLVFISLKGVAAEQNEDVGMRTTILDKNIKKSSFSKNTKFDSLKRKNQLSQSERDHFFNQVKLTPFLEANHVDELDRDLLYMDLKNDSIQVVIVKHPDLPAEALKYAKNHFN